MTALFLFGCGDSRAGKVVTGNFYNPASDTAKDSSKEAGADAKEETDMETETVPDTKTTMDTDLFLITNNDMQSQCLILEQLASGKQYMYNYSITTRFLDKYGNSTNVSYFEPGRVVTIGAKDMKGRVLKVQISDKVWEYPNISKYSIDEERGIFDIAGTKYSYDEKLYVNSDGHPENLVDLTDMDILRIVGMDKKLLSVSVTTGHGELELTNTKLFEGSFIQIGSRIFAEITPDMKMEIPEGTYTAAVANNGYGGSTEIEIRRGEKTTLDLDELKGEGPQFGEILFAIDVAGAVLEIDGKVVDYSKSVPLQYGVHNLTVTADSYDIYSKKLYVNSKEATVVVGLADNAASGKHKNEGSTDENTGDVDTDNNNTTDTNSGNSGNVPGSLAGSLAGNHTGSNGNTGGNTGNDFLSNGSLDEAALNAAIEDMLKGDKKNNSSADYLSTLTELISALKGSDD